MAPFSYSPYGEAWHRDTVVLLGNSLRCEVKDLYVILNSMCERADTLREGDIKSFIAWCEVFHTYLDATMGMFEHEVVPWVEQWSDLPDDDYLEANGGRMKVAKDSVKTINRILQHEHRILALPPDRAFCKLLRILQAWVVPLLRYLNYIEEETSTILNFHSSHVECQSMDRRIATAYAKGPHKQTHLVLLVRHLAEKPQTLAYWKSQNLDMSARFHHPQWWRRVAADHFEHITYFDRCMPSRQRASG